MSSWAPTKYKTKNWSSYNDSLKQRGLLSIWFDPEMVWTPPPSVKHGRQTKDKLAAQRHAAKVGRRVRGELKRIEGQLLDSGLMPDD